MFPTPCSIVNPYFAFWSLTQGLRKSNNFLPEIFNFWETSRIRSKRWWQQGVIPSHVKVWLLTWCAGGGIQLCWLEAGEQGCVALWGSPRSFHSDWARIILIYTHSVTPKIPVELLASQQLLIRVFQDLTLGMHSLEISNTFKQTFWASILQLSLLQCPDTKITAILVIPNSHLHVSHPLDCYPFLGLICLCRGLENALRNKDLVNMVLNSCASYSSGIICSPQLVGKI